MAIKFQGVVMRLNNRPISVIYAVIESLILFGIVSCKRSEDYSSYRHPIEVQIMQLDSVPTSIKHNYIGKIEEGSSLHLRFVYGGTVTAVNVHKGQRVSKGQVLATIDDTQPRNALNTAQATLNQAEDGYNRLKQVYDNGAIAEVQWVDIQTQLDKAQVLVNAAKQQVEDCIITAPETGIIEECDIRVGQQLLPSQTAVRLINIDGVIVSFPVPEQEIASLKIGTEVEIIVPAIGNQSFKGKITEKNMTANAITHSYQAKVSLINRESLLMPGMSCRVNIIDNSQSGLVVPAECIQTTKEGTTVWVVKDGKAHRQLVELGGYVQGGVVIVSGLKKGENIITSGYQKLYQEAEVKY